VYIFFTIYVKINYSNKQTISEDNGDAQGWGLASQSPNIFNLFHIISKIFSYRDTSVSLEKLKFSKLADML